MKAFLKIFVLTTVFFAFASCASAQKGVQIVPDDAQRKVDVLYNGQLFTSYIYPADLEKSVLYPIYTAKGTDITRGFPLNPRPFEQQDHPHHIGSWFNFGDVNGLDFWNNSYAVAAERKSRYGTIRHRSIVSAESGANQGVLVVAADWVDHTEKVLLKEETKFVFKGEGDWRIIERITTLTAQLDTVTFTDNKEGMIAIRMDKAFEEPSDRPGSYTDAHGNITEVRSVSTEGRNGVYRNSEGLTKGDVWGQPTKWVSLSADKEGELITVAILDHKANPGYPAHSHARGYGLFSTNNMGSRTMVNNPSMAGDRQLFKLTLTRGQSVTFKHQIIVKTGSFATDEEINKQFALFNQ